MIPDMKRIGFGLFILFAFVVTDVMSQRTELLSYGDFEHWIERHIKESRIIGGQTKILYEVGPDAVWEKNEIYTNQGGSPWGTSNVMARVCGITKTNTSVYREERGDGFCARLESHVEKVRVARIVNIEVLAAGALFLGCMVEPITGTSNPMSKYSSGIPFTERPSALSFDYKVKLTEDTARIKMTGFSRVSKVAGADRPDVVCALQKRWEDEKGNVHALRVGTMIHRFNKNEPEWINDAVFPIHYGDITNESFFKSYMGLITGDRTMYVQNSKGKQVPIIEEGWADADTTPTHIILQFDSSFGGAYVGSVGTTLWIDNIRFVY